MKPICCLCGRRTTPAGWIGTEPVGPKCAEKAGLAAAAKRAGSKVRLVKIKRTKAERGDENLELFPEHESKP